MGTKRDYYEILGIEKNADAGKIKSAYRKLQRNITLTRIPGMLWRAEV